MANDIGSVKGVTGTSTELNTRRGTGGEKPEFIGKANPGNTKPPRAPEVAVPMPK